MIYAPTPSTKYASSRLLSDQLLRAQFGLIFITTFFFPVTTTPLPGKLSDLWIPVTHTWNLQILSNTFTNHATQTITAPDDILRLTPAKNGLCTNYLQTPGFPATDSFANLGNQEHLTQCQPDPSKSILYWDPTSTSYNFCLETHHRGSCHC
jgi:hypothetical protein